MSTRNWIQFDDFGSNAPFACISFANVEWWGARSMHTETHRERERERERNRLHHCQALLFAILCATNELSVDPTGFTLFTGASGL